MPRVTVNPIQSISVRVNQSTQKTVHNTSTFVGAADVQQQVNEIQIVAENALETANAALSAVQGAYDLANTKLSMSGGTITGNLTVQGVFSNDNAVVDAGLF